MLGASLVRVLRAFIALWFVLSVGEPAAAHFCPMHGGGLVSHATASASRDMAMRPSAGVAHRAGARSAGGHAANHSGGEQGSHHQCTCIDCCVSAGAVALPTTQLALERPLDQAPDAAAWPTADVLPRAAPPHATPLGTGPPRV